MKVIEDGHPYRVQFRCTGAGNRETGCGAMLEASRDDLAYFSERESTFFIHPAAVVAVCPQCGVQTDIPKKEWPERPAETLTPWTNGWRDRLRAAATHVKERSDA